MGLASPRNRSKIKLKSFKIRFLEILKQDFEQISREAIPIKETTNKQLNNKQLNKQRNAKTW